MTTVRIMPHNQTPHPNSRPRFRPGRDEGGFALIMALVFLVLLTLLGVLALNTSDFENMFAANVQQADVNFGVAEGGNALEACNVGFGKRGWYKLKDLERTETPLVPSPDLGFKEKDYNPGDRKKPGFLSNDGGQKYTFADDYKEDEAPEKERMWPFGNLRAKEESDGQVSTDKSKGYQPADKPYDYRYLVTYVAYKEKPGQGTSGEEHGGFGTYTFRIQTSPVAQRVEDNGDNGDNETSSVSQGGIVETSGIRYGMQQNL